MVVKAMVNNLLSKVWVMLDTTDRKELKTALSHFIKRIEVGAQDVVIQYMFRKQVTKKVFVTGDPEGLWVTASVETSNSIILLSQND